MTERRLGSYGYEWPALTLEATLPSEPGRLPRVLSRSTAMVSSDVHVSCYHGKQEDRTAQSCPCPSTASALGLGRAGPAPHELHAPLLSSTVEPPWLARAPLSRPWSGRDRPTVCHIVACARERAPPCLWSLVIYSKLERLLPGPPEWESGSFPSATAVLGIAGSAPHWGSTVEQWTLTNKDVWTKRHTVWLTGTHYNFYDEICCALFCFVLFILL